MMLAGFEGVTGGDISIAGQSVTRTAPYKRNIGMVFQNYALFPHMTIAENLAYPLQVRKMPKADVTERVNEYLNLIENCNRPLHLFERHCRRQTRAGTLRRQKPHADHA